VESVEEEAEDARRIRWRRVESREREREGWGYRQRTRGRKGESMTTPMCKGSLAYKFFSLTAAGLASNSDESKVGPVEKAFTSLSFPISTRCRGRFPWLSAMLAPAGCVSRRSCVSQFESGVDDCEMQWQCS